MRKALTTVLIFLLVLAVLLGLAALWERLRPAAPVQEEEPETQLNGMTPDSATVVRFEEDGASVLGAGAVWSDGVLTIGYPGTYRLSGALEGQVAVDLADFDGAVYLILDGADICCPDGPALHVRQCDLTVLHLPPDTVSSFTDGAQYEVQEKNGVNAGAGIYSADDLRIEGEGALTVTGASADGIRSKDSITVAGGILQVYSMDDALQGSDYVEITGGELSLNAWGDGIAVTEGYVRIAGGTLAVTCGGDGADALGDVSVLGGAVSILTYGGPAYYEQAAEAGLSARGLKGENVSVEGGQLDLSCADDGIHARRDAHIDGGSVSIAAGDDGIRAGSLLELSGGEVVISRCYEGLEGETVALSDCTVTAAAEKRGAEAGEGGFAAENAILSLAAPMGVRSESAFVLRGGSLLLEADGTESLFAFAEADVSGSLLAFADSGTEQLLTEKGTIPGSLLFVFGDPVPAGTRLCLTDPRGEELAGVTRERQTGAVLYAGGALMQGQPYTLSAGEIAMTAEAGEGCSVTKTEPSQPAAGAGRFPMGGPGGRPPR